MNSFSYSASESNAFGLNVYRAKISEMEAGFIKTNFFQRDVDVVISRVDTKIQGDLFEMYGLIPNTFLADTLVYYSCKLKGDETNMRPENIRIERSGPNSEIVLANLISSIFTGYKNHYHTNPLFQSVDLAKGYLEWNLPFLTDPNKVCLILFDHDIPCAFLTASIFREDGYADIILNGALKTYEGQGKYSFLLQELKVLLNEINIPKVIVSTQLTNQRVQMVWARSQFVPYESFYTFHHFISEKSVEVLNKKLNFRI